MQQLGQGPPGGAQLDHLAVLHLHAAPGRIGAALPPAAQLAARVRVADGQQHLQAAAGLRLRSRAQERK